MNILAKIQRRGFVSGMFSGIAAAALANVARALTPDPTPCQLAPRFCRRHQGCRQERRTDRGADYNHYEMGESFGNSYGPSSRVALALMQLPILG